MTAVNEIINLRQLEQEAPNHCTAQRPFILNTIQDFMCEFAMNHNRGNHHWTGRPN